MLRRISISLAVFALVVPASARADETDDCIAASRSGQLKQRDGQLIDAAAEFARCAQPSCPSVIKADCTKQRDDVLKSTPTLVLIAVDANGQDLVEAKVLIDHKIVLERLSGQPTAVDPGPHEVEFVRPTGEHVTVTVLAATGDDRRRVVGRFPPTIPPSPAARAAGHREAATAPGSSSGQSLVWPIGLFAVSAVSIGIATWFQVSGTSDVSDLRDRCGEACPRKDVEELDDTRRTKEWGARIGLGVAIVAAAGGIYLVLRGEKAPPNVASDLFAGRVHF